MTTGGQRFLIVYSAVLTAALLGTVAYGASVLRHRSFDEISVQRINVVEPDGTLRMVISDHARLPGIIVHGQERPFPRPQAGVLFYNDEGSENGGLIFGGRKDAAGKVVDSGGSLSFDRYGANQIVQLLGVDDSTDRIAGLTIGDSPSGTEVHRRVFVGRGDDGVAKVTLADAKGKRRLVLQVTADGTPSLMFLDADGKPTSQMTTQEETETSPH